VPFVLRFRFCKRSLSVCCLLQLQQSQVTSVLSEPQRALLSTINSGMDVIVTVEKELIEHIEVPDVGEDPVSIFNLPKP